MEFHHPAYELVVQDYNSSIEKSSTKILGKIKEETEIMVRGE